MSARATRVRTDMTTDARTESFHSTAADRVSRAGAEMVAGTRATHQRREVCIRRVRTADGAERVADDSFEAAYARHRDGLVRLAGLLTADQNLAEDLVHD